MVIRPVTDSDIEDILNLYTYYILNTTITFEEEVPSIEVFQKRVESIFDRYPFIVAEDEGKIIGFAYATQFRGRSAYRWLVEVAIYVDIHYQGKGAGKKLLEVLFDIIQKLGYYDIYSVITLPNDRSVKLFESFGFTKNTILKQAGYKHGRWCDAGIWVKHLREREAAPVEPESFRQFLSNNTLLSSHP